MKNPRRPQAHYIIEAHQAADALAEFQESANTCIYISGGTEDDEDVPVGIHLGDGDLTLSVRPWRKGRLLLSVASARLLPASQAGSMTPPCFQKVETYDKAGAKLGGEAFSWGCAGPGTGYRGLTV